MRQYAGVLASPDRRPKLAKITAPTVVVHGEADPLVPVEGGRDTAANIPGAQLKIVPGMGHDLPPPSMTPSSRPSSAWPRGRGRAPRAAPHTS